MSIGILPHLASQLLTMGSSLDFTNPGIHFAGVHSSLTQAPPGLVICGLARSGTTAIAAGFRKAGFNLGSGLSNVIEDQSFRRALDSRDAPKIREYFNKPSRVSSDLPMCVKFPDAWRSMSFIAQALPDTFFLVTTRDPFCVAMRNNISMFDDFPELFKRTTAQYREMHEAIMDASSHSPILLVAYEKLISAPIPTFSTIFSSILSWRNDIDQLSRLASGAIELNPKGYLEESNIQACYAIDDVPQGILSGYCFFRSNPERKVILEIFEHGNLITEIACNQPREDLPSQHPTGMCGFHVFLDTIDAPNLHGLSVKIKGTSHRLI
jgi:hypothetical protein